MEKKEISEESVKNVLSRIDIKEIEGEKELIERSSDKQEIERKNYDELLNEIDSLFDRFKLTRPIYERIFEPDRIIEIDVPILLERKSRGKEVIKIFTSYWVEHNNLLGPYLGEINFMPNVGVEEIKELAALSTLKNALLDLPFGGAAGGIAVNPNILNNKERERLARSYLKGMIKFLDLDKDILSGGSGVDEKSISFMHEECKKLEHSTLKEAKKKVEEKTEKSGVKKKKIEERKEKKNLKEKFLGKIFQDGGLRARNQAIASGTIFMLDELLKMQEVANLPGVEKHDDILKKSPRELTIAIHGFNQTEKELAFMLFNAGYKIVALSDSLGAIASGSGINPRDAARWQKNHRSVAGLPKVPRVKKEQLTEIRSEILLLGSEASIIDSKIARKIKANIIIELEDVITSDANRGLKHAKKIVLPYILSSCSTRLINYLEWLQNKENKFLSQEEIDEKIKEKIHKLFIQINKISSEHALDLRSAASLLALQKISEK